MAERDPRSQPPQHALPSQQAQKKIASSLNRLPRIIPVEELLGKDDEVLIACGDQLYRLRRTRQGKLILHK